MSIDILRGSHDVWINVRCHCGGSKKMIREFNCSCGCVYRVGRDNIITSFPCEKAKLKEIIFVQEPVQ